MKTLATVLPLALSIILPNLAVADELQDLQTIGETRAIYALDPPLQTLLPAEMAERPISLGDGLADILHRHIQSRGASFDLANHVMTTGVRFGELYSIVDNRVVVDFTVTGKLNACLDGFTEIDGIKVLATASAPTYHVVSALVPVEDLLAAMAVPEVATAYGAVFQVGGAGMAPGSSSKSQGIADNQAEIALHVDEVRRVWSWVDGGGIEVGTLSDSVNQVGGGVASSQTSDDLPNYPIVRILADWADPDATDEGRAMMEHIFDIAPGLEHLGFATAFGGIATFAANITALGDDGMDIINDDVIYFSEPMFQDGVIAQAADAFVDGGGIYFAANANYANLSYEETFTDDDADNWHEYEVGDELATWTIAPWAVAILGLQWSQPWGAATTDLAIDIYTADNPPTLVYSSTTNNVGGNPYDLVWFSNTGAELTYKIAIRRVSGSVDDLTFKYVFFANGAWQGTLPDYPENATGTLTPHAGTLQSIAIGAAPFFNPNTAETFSGHGPHRRLFDDAGNPVGPFTVAKPDFLSIDKCNTSFFGSDIPEDADALPNFSGTSAATPNAAAVAALMLEVAGGSGTLSTWDLRDIMKISAIDLGDVGHDTIYGYGRIHALGAVVAARGPLGVEYSMYLNQFGDATLSKSLGTNTDIDVFEFSSNAAGAATIDVLDSDVTMDPMAVLFLQFANMLIDVDYDGGAGDDARFDLDMVGNFAYTLEVLSEKDFSTSASIDVVVDAPDQVVLDRTANLDSNGDDMGYAGSLSTAGNSDYFSYTAPTSGSLELELQPTGFLAYLRVYDQTGTLVDASLVSDGYVGGLTVDGIVAGESYVIQIVAWTYLANGTYILSVNFTGDDIFADGFESGNMSAWS